MPTVTIKDNKGNLMYKKHLQLYENISNIYYNDKEKTLLINIRGCPESINFPINNPIIFELEE